jgi:hypothetical protein
MGWRAGLEHSVHKTESYSGSESFIVCNCKSYIYILVVLSSVVGVVLVVVIFQVLIVASVKVRAFWV